jgi:MEMO1 family protein
MSAPGARPPAVAGQFYAAEGRALAAEVEACFLDPRGPGHLPSRTRSPTRHLRAAVVPHAGFTYSGPIAARVYAEVAAERPPATVLILGVDHHGSALRAAVSDRPWMTPLGPIEVDHALVHRLARGPVDVTEDRGPVRIDELAHAAEHSIEVQLPFLEYVLPRPRVVALMVRFGPLRELLEIADVVRAAIAGHDVLLLASTDFSHYVTPTEADHLDHLAIDRILARDPDGLYRTVEEHLISMCGIAPTTVLLAALRGETLTTSLLRWGHSGEAEKMARVVGYAAIALRSPTPLSAP